MSSLSQQNPAERSQRRVARNICAFAGLVAALGACEQEKRVVWSNPLLGRVPGAQTQQPVGDLRESEGTERGTSGRLVVENPDGTKTLIARTPKHLMNHLMYVLQQDDAELFVSQVLSKRTRHEYEQHGVDPKEAFETVKARREDVVKLFKAMPMGEATPGAYLERLGDGTKRLTGDPRVTADLRWRGIDMMFEKGNYRLRWFVGE